MVSEAAAPEPQLLVSASELQRFTDRISGAARIAVDTEAASFHRYVDRVYLVQVSTDQETALIDPLAVEDLAPFGDRLADPDLEIVFHDADYDLRILHRDYGFRARNIFDTRIAAQLASEPAVGLGALLDKHFGVKLNKKLQRADWSRRPLTEEMVRYAADDTRFLPALRDLLARKLEQLERMEWAMEEFRLLEKIRWSAPPTDREAFWRIKGVRSLRPRSLAVLQQLYEWREQTARSLDRAPFRIVGNAALVAIARAAPRSLSKLKATPGVPPSTAHRYGAPVLEAVRAGLALPLKELRRPGNRTRTSADPVYDRRLDQLKALRNRRAKELGMEPGLACPNGTLQAIARAAPKTAKEVNKIQGLRRWQKTALGRDAILAAIRPPAS